MTSATDPRETDPRETEWCETECALDAAMRAQPDMPIRDRISAALHCALLTDCRRKADCLAQVSAMIEAAPGRAEAERMG